MGLKHYKGGVLTKEGGEFLFCEWKIGYSQKKVEWKIGYLQKKGKSSYFVNGKLGTYKRRGRVLFCKWKIAKVVLCYISGKTRLRATEAQVLKYPTRAMQAVRNYASLVSDLAGQDISSSWAFKLLFVMFNHKGLNILVSSLTKAARYHYSKA